MYELIASRERKNDDWSCNCRVIEDWPLKINPTTKKFCGDCSSIQPGLVQKIAERNFG